MKPTVLTDAEIAAIEDIPLGRKDNKPEKLKVHIFFSCEPRYNMYDENGGRLTKERFYNQLHIEHVRAYEDGKNPTIGYSPMQAEEIEKLTKEMEKPENKYKKPKNTSLYAKQIFIDCSDIAYNCQTCVTPTEDQMLKKLFLAITAIKRFF